MGKGGSYHIIILAVRMNESELVIIHHSRVEGTDRSNPLAYSLSLEECHSTEYIQI